MTALQEYALWKLMTRPPQYLPSEEMMLEISIVEKTLVAMLNTPMLSALLGM